MEWAYKQWQGGQVEERRKRDLRGSAVNGIWRTSDPRCHMWHYSLLQLRSTSKNRDVSAEANKCSGLSVLWPQPCAGLLINGFSETHLKNKSPLSSLCCQPLQAWKRSFTLCQSHLLRGVRHKRTQTALARSYPLAWNSISAHLLQDSGRPQGDVSGVISKLQSSKWPEVSAQWCSLEQQQ